MSTVFDKLGLDLPTLALGGDVVVSEIRTQVKFDENNNPTTEVKGQAYTVVFPRNGFQKMDVKTKDLTPVMSPEQLDAIMAEGKTVVLTAEGFALQFYATDQRKVVIAGTAEKVALKVKEEKS